MPRYRINVGFLLHIQWRLNLIASCLGIVFPGCCHLWSRRHALQLHVMDQVYWWLHRRSPNRTWSLPVLYPREVRWDKHMHVSVSGIRRLCNDLVSCSIMHLY